MQVQEALENRLQFTTLTCSLIQVGLGHKGIRTLQVLGPVWCDWIQVYSDNDAYKAKMRQKDSSSYCKSAYE